MSTVSYYIKTDRSSWWVRRYVWFVTLLIGIGGQFVPALGLLVPPIMAALILMSLFKGKYWCGNFCPHGSFFDQVIMPISRNNKIPTILKARPLIAAVFIFFIANMSFRFWNILQHMGDAPLWEQAGFVFANTYLMVLLVGGLIGVVVNSRTWCQFCPMGTMETIFYKLGKKLGLTNQYDEKVTIEHPGLCHSCGKCARVCPMQLEPYRNFSDNHQFEDEKCIRCYTCVNNCPASILHMVSEEKTKEIRENVSLKGFEEAKYYSARIKSIEELTKEVRQYTFQLEQPSEMAFIPGQFLLVEIMPEIEMYRAYTISGANKDNTEVSVTVKKLQDGYGTNILFENFKEGDRIAIKGPMGQELQVDHTSSELLFIANGIGVTPFVATVQKFFQQEEANGEKYRGNATMLYGVRYEEDLVYDDLFEQVAEKHDNFYYYRILSRPRTGNYPKGYVSDLLENMEIKPETKAYICGTPKMAKDVKQILADKGVPSENIHYEDFGL